MNHYVRNNLLRATARDLYARRIITGPVMADTAEWAYDHARFLTDFLTAKDPDPSITIPPDATDYQVVFVIRRVAGIDRYDYYREEPVGAGVKFSWVPNLRDATPERFYSNARKQAAEFKRQHPEGNFSVRAIPIVGVSEYPSSDPDLSDLQIP